MLDTDLLATEYQRRVGSSMKTMVLTALAVGAIVCSAGSALAQRNSNPEYSAKVPSDIETPDRVRTRAGLLRYKDGVPDKRTVEIVYDQLDLARGIESFMQGMPATSVYAICRGLSDAGVPENKAIGLTETLMDARSLFLTPNTTTPYGFSCLDLTAGPMVLEAPPGVLGPVDDAYFRWVVDVGLTGPDGGRGGKYLFVPPGYTGTIPDGYFVSKPATNRLLFFFRAFVENGDVAGAVAGVKAKAKLYPLSAAVDPPATTFVNVSGKQFNTISANTIEFYDELNAVVQNEPADFVSPETVGLFSAIGIKKGQPFKPDARMRRILTEAIAIGNGAARALLWAPRDKRTRIYPDRKWQTGFIGDNYQFLDGAERLLDAQSMFFYYATGITPAMAGATVGSGSRYAAVFLDSKGNELDGGKTYKVTLPGPVPAKQFWSLQVYSNQTRSLLETNQKAAGIDSNEQGMKVSSDGSYTVYFGPKAPRGQEKNWIQTTPGRGYNVLLRLYGPLEPWFDKSWKPGDFELVR